jgi:tetratricopeptide (TPR) repeat protein
LNADTLLENQDVFDDRKTNDTTEISADEILNHIYASGRPKHPISLSRSTSLGSNSVISENNSSLEAANLKNQAIQNKVQGNFRVSLDLLQKALDLYKKNEDRMGIAESLLWSGMVNYEMGYYETAFTQSRKALEKYRQLEHLPGIAHALNIVGSSQVQLGNPENALEFQLEAISKYEESGLDKGVAASLTRIGHIFEVLNNYEKSLEYQLRAREIIKNSDDVGDIATSMVRIGHVYRNLNKFDLAMKYFQIAIKLFQDNGAEWEIPYCLMELGLGYEIIGNYEKAIDLQNQAKQKFATIGDSHGFALALQHSAHIHTQKMEFRKALGLYFELLTVSEKIGAMNQVATAYNQIGSLFINLKDYGQAYQYLTLGSEIAELMKAKIPYMENLSQQARLYSAQGDYEREVFYLKKLSQEKRSVYNYGNENRINALQVKYEESKRQAEERIRIIIGLIIVFTLVICLIFAFARYQYLQRKLQQNREKQKTLRLESQLNLFQTRINPHFLFNSLDAIIGISNETKPEKLRDVIHKLSGIYKSILASAESATVPLGTELELIRRYLDIEMIISRQEFEYKVSASEAVISCEILPMILLTVVENAITHGIKSIENAFIEISVDKKGQTLELTVSDNGKGFDLDKAVMGFGLYSVQERLKLFYQNRAKLNLHSEPGEGTRGKIEIPL